MESMNQKQQQQQQQHRLYPTELTSFATPNNAVIQHIDWIIEINFQEQIIISKAIYTIRLNNSNYNTHNNSNNDNDNITTNVILDTSNLIIKSIQGVVEQVQEVQEDYKYDQTSPTSTKTVPVFIDTPYTLDDCIPNKIHLGQKLTIDITKLVVPVPIVQHDNYTTDSFQQQEQGQQNDIVTIQIEYETKKKQTTTTNSSYCGAIQWLTCNQTIDKIYPFMFTQCFPIHARSLLPCQDMPCVKFTYTATVTVPIWSHPVLSAIDITSSKSKVSSGSESVSETQEQQKQHTFYFEQTIPMSSYLLAIACGQLEKRTISSRCDVYSEPSIINSVQYEFQPVEHFLQIAESIVCSIPGTSTCTDSISNSSERSNDDITSTETINTYVWKRYDIICLPYSFPYGGAENPCMTFITPTLLTGTNERPLVDVIAHEIAHSWTGNLITCNTWNDFWLNEGWTMWFQRKIMQQKYLLSKSKTSTMDEQQQQQQQQQQQEHEQYSQLLYDFDSLCGYEELCETIRTVSNENSKLVLNILDNDPDEYYSRIAYEKGYYFLSYLESIVGSKEQFLIFFQYYIKTFSTIGTISSIEFRTCFINYFSSFITNINDIDWDLWYNQPGLPSITIQYDTTLALQSESLANEWITYNTNLCNNNKEHATTGTNTIEHEQEQHHIPTTCIQDWTSNQIIYFLDKLICKTIVATDTNYSSSSCSTGSNGSPECWMLQSKTIQLLDEQYNLSISKNSEIVYRFCRIVIDCNVYKYWSTTVIPFITSQGRMKYIRPLYRALYNNNNNNNNNNSNTITSTTTTDNCTTTGSNDTSTSTVNAITTNGIINGRTVAIELFHQYKNFYHPICSKMIASDLHITL